MCKQSMNKFLSSLFSFFELSKYFLDKGISLTVTMLLIPCFTTHSNSLWVLIKPEPASLLGMTHEKFYDFRNSLPYIHL